jgi:asparagine synthase (glutamine-hydrolysing)
MAMRDIIAHRGPDDAGIWASDDGQAILGHRRLSILDLTPSGHQPMRDESRNFTIVFNGEIYNFVELREELKSKGYRFRSSSDTEVLLAAYNHWGTDCLSRLNGMFGFAIWDEHRHHLFAARDRFGEKPFYYFCGGGVFLFGSEIKALLASQLINVRPNHRAICRYLLHHESDCGAETPLEGIFALPPAHGLLYSPSQGEFKTWQYWDLDPHREILLPSDAAYAERFRELMQDSVRIRLRSDVPVGSSLSGGLDSSTIVRLVASQLKGTRQTTFSARFEDPRIDEGPYIECLTRHFALESNNAYPTPTGLLENISRITWHQEHPSCTASTYAQWTVMRLAREHGVTVLLDGQGGDEILAGYPSYHASYFWDLLKGWRWRSFLAAIGGQIRLQGPTRLPSTLAPLLPDSLRGPLRRFLRPPGISADFEHRWASPPTSVPAPFTRWLFPAK